MARLLRAMMTDLGFAVIEARGADDALAQIERRSADIHLVLCELSLRELSGPKLARFISRRLPEVPIVLLCDKRVPDHVDITSRAAFLKKPFTQSHLVKTINQLTG